MKRSGKKGRGKGAPSAQEVGVFRQVRGLQQVRQPYEALLRRVVSNVCAGYSPLPEGPIVEVGAGDGQLRPLLPGELVGRVVHTEPLASCARELRRRFPEAEVRQAAANRLPFEDGSCAGALALCVFDVIDDLGSAVGELHRVLAPGAPVIHLLDQNAYLRDIFARLAPLGMVPLPNVFSDPCVNAWPDDVFLVPAAQLQRVLDVLHAHGHPYQRPLRRYLSLFQTAPVVLDQVLAEFDHLASKDEHRVMLTQLLRTAFDLASPEQRAELAAFQGQSVSSAQQLARRLEKAFAPEAGFAVELSEIVAVSSVSPIAMEGAAPRYLSLAVGQHRALPAIPGSLLLPIAPRPAPEEMLRELGVFAFVARRLP